MYSYLLDSFIFWACWRETENQRQRGSLQHIQRSKRTRYLHGIWTICIFLRSVDSLLSHCLIEYASWSARDAALVQIFPYCFFYNPPPQIFSHFSLYSFLLSSTILFLKIFRHISRPPSWTQIVILAQITATSTLPPGWI